MEGCRGSDGGLAAEGGFVSRRQELGWPSPLRMNTLYTHPEIHSAMLFYLQVPGLPSHSLPLVSLSNSNLCFISTTIMKRFNNN